MITSGFLLQLGRTTGSARMFTTTLARDLNQKWRQQRGLPLNPNACGVLTDGSDYSYLDGRTTPYGVRQRLRITKQQEIADRIMLLTHEVHFAVNRHKQMKLDEENHRKEMIATRLKPKGDALLKGPSSK